MNPFAGIQEYKNDGRLTAADRQSILDWVDAGAPLGPIEALPSAKQFPDPNRWQLADEGGRQDRVGFP